MLRRDTSVEVVLMDSVDDFGEGSIIHIPPTSILQYDRVDVEKAKHMTSIDDTLAGGSQ